MELLTAAAEQDLAPAQGVLAYIYGKGAGVPQNKEKFLHWVQRAAMNGDAASQFNVAILYLTGEMLDKNPDEARFWLIKSADQGLVDAQVTLGEVYLQGLDQEPNLVAACKWFAIAGVAGNPQANAYLMQVTQAMNREQLNDAAAQANAWLNKQAQ